MADKAEEIIGLAAKIGLTLGGEERRAILELVMLSRKQRSVIVHTSKVLGAAQTERDLYREFIEDEL